MLGVTLALIYATTWSIGLIFTRLGLQYAGALQGSVISLISSLILVGIAAFIMEFDALLALSLVAFLWFVLIGFMEKALARYANYEAIRRLGVSRASPIGALFPVFATLFAVIFTGEDITIPIGVGLALMVVGTYLLTSRRPQ